MAIVLSCLNRHYGGYGRVIDSHCHRDKQREKERERESERERERQTDRQTHTDSKCRYLWYGYCSKLLNRHYSGYRRVIDSHCHRDKQRER